MAGFRAYGVILCCFLACEVSWCKSAMKSGKHELQECSEVRQLFMDRNIGPGSMVPKDKVHDTEMDICYHGLTHPNRKSCCTRAMEHKYHQATEAEFRDAIQSTSAYLKNLMQLSSQHYQDKFLEMVEQAENNTDTLFAKVYKIPLRERRGTIENLFLNLKSYIRKLDENISIQDSTEQFFDEIFPLVFKHSLNGLGEVELSEDYRLCLMETRRNLHQQPFGEYPNKLSHDLAKSLGSARDFLQATNLAIEVVNTTDHFKLEHRCSKALTRLTSCAQCEGLTSLRPCKDYCRNVMRGCLADLSALNSSWNAFADTLDTMTSNMRGSYSIENVMRSFHTQVSDALMNALEVGPKFYPEIVEKCGQPHGENKNSDVFSSPQKPNTALFRPSWDLQTPDLHTKLSMFMRTLVASKGFYDSLPDTLCTSEKFSVGVQQQCWNGEGEGIYNKTVVANNLAEQRAANPEFMVTTETPEVIAVLKDKLVRMTEQLNSRITSEMMYQSDDWSAGGYDTYRGSQGKKTSRRKYSPYDYGSGYYSSDDEDYEYSGSGSGYDYDSHEGKTHVKPRHKPSGVAHSQENDWNFSDGDSAYVTERPPGGTNSQRGNNLPGSAESLRSYSSIFVLTVFSILLWRVA